MFSKKLCATILSALLILSIVSCSGEKKIEISQSSGAKPSSEANNLEGSITQKTLVVYFSMPETANADNLTEDEENSVVVINGEVLGNTQYVAQVIRDYTEADLFRIEPATPYPTNHQILVDLAKEEQRQGVRPEIKSQIENFDQYETIFVGYPNWWGDMPMIMYSFFDEYDFDGKTIIPFNTHGGSGFSNTITTIAELEPDGIVSPKGFTISRNDVENAENDIVAWLTELDIGK